jgi:hypothetical protein
MKSALHNVALFIHGKSRRKARSDEYWTDIYPNPRPSFLYAAINKSCDWIFMRIDHFFQGSKIHTNAKPNNSDPIHCEKNQGSEVVWELNQDIADIAINDLREGIGWLLPERARQYLYRIYQQLLLYFFIDIPGEDEVSNPLDLDLINMDINAGRKSKVISVIQELKEDASCKFLSIHEWWVRLFHKLYLLLHSEPQKKTFYLLGNFTPKGYDYSVDNQNYMIREPDKTNLNPAFSFHKRN